MTRQELSQLVFGLIMGILWIGVGVSVYLIATST